MAELVFAGVIQASASPAKHVASPLACRDPVKLHPPDGNWRIIRTRARVEALLSIKLAISTVGSRVFDKEEGSPVGSRPTRRVPHLLQATRPFLRSEVMKAILEDLLVDIEPATQS